MFKSFLKKAILKIKGWLGLQTPPVILPYRGFGNQSQVLVAGHVLDDRLLYEAGEKDRTRKNMQAMLSRYWSTSVPDIRVSIELLGHRAEVRTDENGLFEKLFQFEQPLAETGWQPIRCKVLDKIHSDQELVTNEGEVYIYPGQADFGIISDVDDTILVSHATNVLKKLRLILTKNSRTRLPFKGVSAFYQALQAGKHGKGQHPIFYVSSSEWNLYDLLVDFCRVRGIPKGPFLLKDLKTNLFKLYRSGGGSHDHKLEKIRSIMKLYPQLSFVLIGDSGQRDPLLYETIVKEFPGRILSVYIRDVAIPKKAALVREISDRLRGQEVEMLLISDTGEAAKHAHGRGLISENGLQKVLKELEDQEGKDTSLLGQVMETP